MAAIESGGRGSPRAALALRRIGAVSGGNSSVLILTTAGMNLVRLVGTMVLTRLLNPEAFGAVGIIVSIFFLLGMITDLGFQNYIVRHPRGGERHFLDAIWTVHAVRGLALTVAAVALADPVALFLGKPELAWPLAVASATFAINGVASLTLMTAIRNGLLRRLCLFDLALQVFQTAVGIAAAASLGSVWAIIVAMLAHSLAHTALSYVAFPDAGHRPRLDRPIFAEFWLFSQVIMKSSMLSLLLSQSDKLVLARLFSTETFGLYAIAANLAAAPFTFVVAYSSKLLYPIYAAAWRDAPETLPTVYYAAKRKIALLYGFAAGGLVGAAPLVIALLYDERYHSAAIYLALLAISPVLVLSTASATEFLMACGNPRATLQANLVRVIWLFAAGVAGFLLIGPLGIVAAAGAIELAPLVLCWILLRRAGVLDLRQELPILAVSLAGLGAGSAATALLIRFF